MILVWVFLAGGLVFFVSWLCFRDLSGPAPVYVFVWIACIALLHLDLVDYHPVGEATWRAVFLSAAVFLLSCWAAMLWGLSLPSKKRVNRERETPLLALDRKRYVRAVAVLGGLGLVGFLLQLWHLQQTIGLETFFNDPRKARALHSSIKYWGYFNILNISNVVLVVLYWCRFRKPRWWMLLMFVTATASALVSTDRTRFFYMVLWSLFAAWYASGGMRFNWRKGFSSLAVLALLLVFFIAVGRHYQRLYWQRFPEHIHFSPQYSFLVEPYIYFTGSLPALEAMMADENPLYGGRFSFSPVVTILSPFFDDLKPVDLAGKFYFVPMEINTYSYLQQFYQDFGWIGLIWGPMFYGFLSGWFYILMVRSPRFFRVYAASLMAYCCCISVFVNMFTQEATWFFLGVGWLLGRYLESPRAPAEDTKVVLAAKDGL